MWTIPVRLTIHFDGGRGLFRGSFRVRLRAAGIIGINLDRESEQVALFVGGQDALDIGSDLLVEQGAHIVGLVVIHGHLNCGMDVTSALPETANPRPHAVFPTCGYLWQIVDNKRLIDKPLPMSLENLGYVGINLG